MLLILVRKNPFQFINRLDGRHAVHQMTRHLRRGFMKYLIAFQHRVGLHQALDCLDHIFLLGPRNRKRLRRGCVGGFGTFLARRGALRRSAGRADAAGRVLRPVSRKPA